MSARDDFRAALAARNEVAERARGLRTRAGRLGSDVGMAEQESDEAAEGFRTALAASACGEAADVDSARERRDLASERLAELKTMAEGLRARLATVDAELEAARKVAARARKGVCLERAPTYEAALRVAASTFAETLRQYHKLGQTAATAAYEETNQIGVQPIPLDGRRGLLVSDTDSGVIGLFEANNVSRQLTVIRRESFSEAELLAEDATEPTTQEQRERCAIGDSHV